MSGTAWGLFSLSTSSGKVADVVHVPSLVLQHKIWFETRRKKPAQVNQLRKGLDHLLLKTSDNIDDGLDTIPFEELKSSRSKVQ